MHWDRKHNITLLIDGKPVAESPVMRISQEPWRFDVNIPKGSRRINLVCIDENFIEFEAKAGERYEIISSN